jgi:hypothetical protein
MCIVIQTWLPEKPPTASEISQAERATAEYHELVFTSNKLSKYEYIEFISNNDYSLKNTLYLPPHRSRLKEIANTDHTDDTDNRW